MCEPDGVGQKFGGELDRLALGIGGCGEIAERIGDRLVAENVMAEKIATEGALLELVDVADLPSLSK